MQEISSKLTQKTLERHQCRSGFLFIKSEQISHTVLVLFMLTLNK